MFHVIYATLALICSRGVLSGGQAPRRTPAGRIVASKFALTPGELDVARCVIDLCALQFSTFSAATRPARCAPLSPPDTWREGAVVINRAGVSRPGCLSLVAPAPGGMFMPLLVITLVLIEPLPLGRTR